jgi:guanylate kinase
MRAGFLVIISGPSGSGKSTVCRRLRRRDSGLRYSISCCTREPRPSEVDGRDYHFLSVGEFRRMIGKGQFLEWAKVHGNYYGTPRRFIDDAVGRGQVVLLDIDVQGAGKIRRKTRDAVTIFLFPPSWPALRRRLELRRDTADSMAVRMSNARYETRQAGRYDFWVVNDELDVAVRQIEAIILATKLRAGRPLLKPESLCPGG